jgi:G:T-mismatch repair DNA endonuclease (very short patch repair protein)
MADVFDKKTRSKIMSKVKSKGNKSTENRGQGLTLGLNF